jgi:AcrR family transcriptional regulator
MESLAAECGVNARALYYHFASKRELFTAATQDAFDRFGTEVLARVFNRATLQDRVKGYVDVYRALHASDPSLLPFIGMVLVDGLSSPDEGTRTPSDGGTQLRQFLGKLVDDAIARGEVHPDVDRDGALLLLTAMGMGLMLVSLNGPPEYPAMLDTLDRFADGSLFVAPEG